MLRDLRWSQFLAVADARGERGNPRLHYLDGVLELMHSSWEHELRKKLVSRCFEAWADAMDVAVNGCGSFTIVNRARDAAAEADDCYYVGRVRRGPPDLVIEKQWLEGEIDQVELYRRLGVREVWLWDHRHIHRHRLVRGGALEADIPLLERCLRMETQTQAVKWLRAALKH